MAIPVINPTTSILAYKQWEAWEYQPYATNTPTGWTSGPRPPGMTLNAATGKISGAAQSAGIYLVELLASNASGSSAPLVLTIGIEPAAVAPDAKLDVTIDVDTGEVKLVSYGAQQSQQQQQQQSSNAITPAPLLSVKEDDDLLMRVFFLKGGGVIDLNLTALKFAIKELEPESVLDLSTPAFAKLGSGANACFLLHVRFDGDLLAGSLSNYEEDQGTFFSALAEIERIETNPETVGPVELRRSSQTFRVRIERDLIA